MKERAHVLASACKDYEEDLVLYYYGEIAEPQQRQIDIHLKDCRRCGDFLADVSALVPQTRSPEELPPAFWHNYYAEVMEKVERAQLSWWQKLAAPMRIWLLPAFGTAAMAVLAVALITGDGRWNFGPDPQESVPQEILVDASKVEFFRSMDLLESLRVLEKMEVAPQAPAGAQQL